MARPKEPGIITTSQEVALRWLGRGLKPKEIAERMDTSREAINIQLWRARQRLNAKNNVQAVINLWHAVDPG